MSLSGRFEIERVGGAVSTEDLLQDLRNCGKLQSDGVVTQVRYADVGKYDPTTFIRRFGSWNRAVEAAGFQAGNVVNYGDDALFANLMMLWEHNGRQPRRSELASPPSRISQHPYLRRFRTWTSALQAFVDYANAAYLTPNKNEEAISSRRTARTADLRLKFQVLKRDDFRCQACGKSPSAFPGLHLHVDHKVAWSKGGETTLDNLQTLCEPCNLGKSNVL
jgi:hypothetical protein